MFSIYLTFDHIARFFVLNTDVEQRQDETEAYDCVVVFKGDSSPREPVNTF